MKMSTEHPVISTKQQLSDEYVIFHKCSNIFVLSYVCVLFCLCLCSCPVTWEPLEVETCNKCPKVCDCLDCGAGWNFFVVLHSQICDIFSIQQSNAAWLWAMHFILCKLWEWLRMTVDDILQVNPTFLKGKATFEAHFHVLPIASYSWLWYPLVMNYNYLNPLLFNYYTHFTLRRFCDAQFLLKQTVQSKQFGLVSVE